VATAVRPAPKSTWSLPVKVTTNATHATTKGRTIAAKYSTLLSPQLQRHSILLMLASANLARLSAHVLSQILIGEGHRSGAYLVTWSEGGA
jgi:hypothetical protein